MNENIIKRLGVFRLCDSLEDITEERGREYSSYENTVALEEAYETKDECEKYINVRFMQCEKEMLRTPRFVIMEIYAYKITP